MEGESSAALPSRPPGGDPERPSLAPEQAGPSLPPPIERDPRVAPRRRGGLGWLLVAGLAVLKFGKFLLVPLKLLKLGKFGVTFLSMAASVWVYALFYGWRFAAGLVGLILVHEMGHAVVLRRRGLAAGAPVFLPLLGAFIAMRRNPPDALTEAQVGIAGPIAGSLAAAACAAIWALTGSPLWMALAFTGFTLNLFNLLPVHPLDGGRTVGAIGRWLRLGGVGALVPAIVLIPSPLMLLIALFAGLGLLREWRAPREEARAYYATPLGARLAVATAYFGLVAALGAATLWSHGILEQSRAGLMGG